MAGDSKLTAEAYLRKAREEIVAWEAARRGYFARMGDFMFTPAAKWTERMIPKPIQNAASHAIERTLLITAHAGGFSIDRKALAHERSATIGRKRALVPRLRACDALARKFWRSHCGYAAAQGAATGFAGLAGFIADIPLILSIAIREIRTIGLCYGYLTTSAGETDYVLHVLRAGSSSESEVRGESLSILRRLEPGLRRSATMPKPSGDKASRVRYLMTIQEYAKSLGIQLIRRNALQLIPLAGIVTSASFNALYANDIGRAAYMCYRRRFIEDAIASAPKASGPRRQPRRSERRAPRATAITGPRDRKRAPVDR